MFLRYQLNPCQIGHLSLRTGTELELITIVAYSSYLLWVIWDTSIFNWDEYTFVKSCQLHPKVNFWTDFVQCTQCLCLISSWRAGLAQRLLSQVIWGEPHFHGCSWPHWRSQLTCLGGMSPVLVKDYPALVMATATQSLLEKFLVWFHKCTPQ